MATDAELDAYLLEAASWDADRVALTERSARVAWWIAAAGWTCAIVSGIALLLLMPLKRVDPFVIRVDSTTGLVDVVPVYVGTTDLPEAVTRYFLTHYVTTCERFNFTTAEADYEECGSFHTPLRNQAWYELWNTNNPASPLNVHKDGTSLRVQVSSVSFFKRANGVADLAHVRYTKGRRSSGGVEDQITHWIATIQYAYADPPSDPKMRRWNPLGFKVVEFRAEPEVTAAPVTVAPNSVTSSAATPVTAAPVPADPVMTAPVSAAPLTLPVRVPATPRGAATTDQPPSRPIEQLSSPPSAPRASPSVEPPLSRTTEQPSS